MPLKPSYIDTADTSRFKELKAGDELLNAPDVSFDSISDMMGYDIDNSPRTKTAQVVSFYGDGKGGGGVFYWDASEDKANHNGIDVIDPTHSVTPGSAGWWTDENTGTGCFKRPEQEYIYLPEAGLKGDGTDEYHRLNPILTTYSNIKGDPNKEYKTGTKITVTNTDVDHKDVNIVGTSSIAGDIITFAITDNVTGRSITSSSDSDNVIDRGHKDIVLDDVTNIQEGQIFELESDELWPYDNRGTLTKGELNIVDSVDGETNTVTMKWGFADTYNISTETLTIRFTNRYTARFKNCSCKHESAVEKAGFSISRYFNPVFRDCDFSNSAEVGLSLGKCIDARVYGGRIHDNYVSGTSIGYGVQDNSSHGTLVFGASIHTNRRGVDFSGQFPSRFGTVAFCDVVGVDGVGSCLGTHGTSDRITFAYNKLSNGQTGFITRGKSAKIIGNDAYDTGVAFLAVSDGAGLELKNNTLHDAQGTYNVGDFITKTGTVQFSEELPLVVENNTVGSNLTFIEWDADNFEYAFIKNNKVTINSNTGANDVYFLKGSGTIQNSIIQGNDFTVLNGNEFFIDTSSWTIGAFNQIQPFDMQSSSITFGGGSGTVSDFKYGKCEIRDNSGLIQMVFEITVTAGRTVKVQSPFDFNDVFNDVAWIGDGLDKTQTFIATDLSGVIYFSADGSSYNSLFSAGTYELHINSELPLKEPK